MGLLALRQIDSGYPVAQRHLCFRICFHWCVDCNLWLAVSVGETYQDRPLLLAGFPICDSVLYVVLVLECVFLYMMGSGVPALRQCNENSLVAHDSITPRTLANPYPVQLIRNV